MHDSAIQITEMERGTESYLVLQGAINLIARTIPLIFEEKEF